MSSEYTRRSHLLNSSIQVGRYSATRSEESYASRLPTSGSRGGGGALSDYLSSRSTVDTDATNNSDDYKSYDSLLRRIRAEQAESLNPNSSSTSSSSSYLTSSRYGSGSGFGGGVGAPVSEEGPRELFAHSRHQEMMKNRRKLDAYNYSSALTSGSSTGAGGADASDSMDQQQQQQQQNYATSPTSPGENEYANRNRPMYTVRNIPVRSLDEVRETIAIRRQYYRERLFGKNDDESGDGENTNQDLGTGLTSMAVAMAPVMSGESERVLRDDDTKDDILSEATEEGARNVQSAPAPAVETAIEDGSNCCPDKEIATEATDDGTAEGLQSCCGPEAECQEPVVIDCVNDGAPDALINPGEDVTEGKIKDQDHGVAQEDAPVLNSVAVFDSPSVPDEDPIATATVSESDQKAEETKLDEIETLVTSARDAQMSIEALSVSCTESETVCISTPEQPTTTSEAREETGPAGITIKEVESSHTVSNTVRIELEQTPEPGTGSYEQSTHVVECESEIASEVDTGVAIAEQNEPPAEAEFAEVEVSSEVKAPEDSPVLAMSRADDVAQETQDMHIIEGETGGDKTSHEENIVPETDKGNIITEDQSGHVLVDETTMDITSEAPAEIEEPSEE